MFLFKRPLAAALAGIVTAFIGIILDAAFDAVWTAHHAAALV